MRRLWWLLLALVLLAGCVAAPDGPADADGFGPLTWPTGQLAALLPVPDAQRGFVEQSDGQTLLVYLADCSAEEFQRYAEACWQEGFSVSYHLSDRSFTADRISGEHLSMQLLDTTLCIHLRAPENAVAERVTPTAAAEAETQRPSSDWKRTESPQESASTTECDYVLNRSSKRFHRPECTSVSDIKEENRVAFHGTREALLAEGYEPCKRCTP